MDVSPGGSVEEQPRAPERTTSGLSPTEVEDKTDGGKRGSQNMDFKT